jgi:hypothetical protein
VNSANRILTVNVIITNTTNDPTAKVGLNTVFLKVIPPDIDPVASIIVRETEASPVAWMVTSKPSPAAGYATDILMLNDKDTEGVLISWLPRSLSMVAAFLVFDLFPAPGQLIVKVMEPDGKHAKRGHAKLSAPETVKVKPA